MASSSSSSCPQPLFDAPDCIVNSPCKVDFDFVLDCALPELPPPIYDCPAPVCPIFEPPPDEFCPEISEGENTNVSVSYVNTRCGSSSSSAKTDAVFIISKNEFDCSFDIDFNLDLAIPLPPCPIFTADDPKISVFFDTEECAKPPSTLKVTPADNCSSCEFNIELDLAIPIPKPRCPIFRAKNPVSISTYFDSAGCSSPVANELIVNTTEIPGDCNTPGTCEFEITLDLVIPIPKIRCPIFKSDNPVTVTTTLSDCGTTAPSTLKVTSTPIPGDCNNSDTCEFQIELDLNIPIPSVPCPTIKNEQSVTVRSVYLGGPCSTTPPSRFKVITTEKPGNCALNQPDSCEFEFDLDLYIPIINPPCPIFNDGKVNLNYNNTTNPSTLKILPRPPSSASCDRPTQCEFDIELDLNIDIPCPKINIRNTLPSRRYENDTFDIVGVTLFPISTDTDNCLFDIQFDLLVPPSFEAPYVRINEAIITQSPGNCDKYTLKFSEPSIRYNPATRRWEIAIDPELEVPTPTVYRPGPIDIGEFGYGDITIEDIGPCEKQIKAKITLNTAVCTSGGGYSGGGGDDTGGGTSGGGGGGGPPINLLQVNPNGPKSILDLCDAPNGECPADAVNLCPKGSRCNPHLD